MSALRLDKSHVKSLFRHGTALYYLKKYKEAKHEFNNLLRADPSNKNGLEYLRHTEQKLAKIKAEAYEKLYYGEIIGNTTGIGKGVIKVEEIHMDPKLKKQMEEEKQAKLDQVEDKPTDSKSKPLIKEIDSTENSKTADAAPARESKSEFLSKTDVSGITRNKEEQKDTSQFVENAEEEEELRKLEEERQNQKAKKKGKRKNKKKKTHEEESKEVKQTSSQPQNIDAKTEENKINTEVPQDSEGLKITLGDEVEGDSSPNSENNTLGVDEHGDTNLKITIEEMEESNEQPETVSLSFGVNKLDFEHAHEIHTEKETSPVARQIKEECLEIKKKIVFDEEEEYVEVVKSDEGKFYTLKCQKPPVIRPILKAKSCMAVIPDNMSERSSVFFDLNGNEIRDFKKNDRVNWPQFKSKVSYENSKKDKTKSKKRKGKGKNRMQTDEVAKEKEQKKIEKARKKQEELRMLEEMDVDDDFDDDDDMEACNAPSTRKAKSQPVSDAKSPFHGDSLVSFGETSDKKEVKSALIEFDIPTKAAQLERDLKSMK